MNLIFQNPRIINLNNVGNDTKNIFKENDYMLIKIMGSIETLCIGIQSNYWKTCRGNNPKKRMYWDSYISENVVKDS